MRERVRGSAGAEGLGGGGDDFVVRDVVESLGDVPAVSERVGQLAMALAPEGVAELVSSDCAGTDGAGPRGRSRRRC